MKRPQIQWTPTLIAALLCAVLWFALWLVPFKPAPPASPSQPPVPDVIQLDAARQPIRVLRDPTLFSLPSSHGFSGDFPGPRVELSLALEKPKDPVRFLPLPPTDPPKIDPQALSEENPRPPRALPGPDRTVYPKKSPPEAGRLFLSPELEARTDNILRVDSALTGLPETVYAWLSIRADGTVEQVIFQTPIENPALLSELRQLRFEPAEKPVSGEISIHFNTAGEAS